MFIINKWKFLRTFERFLEVESILFNVGRNCSTYPTNLCIIWIIEFSVEARTSLNQSLNESLFMRSVRCKGCFGAASMGICTTEIIQLAWTAWTPIALHLCLTSVKLQMKGGLDEQKQKSTNTNYPRLLISSFFPVQSTVNNYLGKFVFKIHNNQTIFFHWNISVAKFNLKKKILKNWFTKNMMRHDRCLFPSQKEWYRQTAEWKR